MAFKLFAAIFLSSSTFDLAICGQSCGLLGICTSTDETEQVHDLRRTERTAVASLVAITVHRRDDGQFLKSCIGVLREPDIVITLESCLDYGIWVEVVVSPISSDSWIAHRGNTEPIKFDYFSGDHSICSVGSYLFVLKLPQTAVNEDARLPIIAMVQNDRGTVVIHHDGITLIQDAEGGGLLARTVEDKGFRECQKAFPKMNHDDIVCVKETQQQTPTGSPYFKVTRFGNSILRGLFVSNTKKLGAYASTIGFDKKIRKIVKTLRGGVECGSVRFRCNDV